MNVGAPCDVVPDRDVALARHIGAPQLCVVALVCIAPLLCVAALVCVAPLLCVALLVCVAPLLCVSPLLYVIA